MSDDSVVLYGRDHGALGEHVVSSIGSSLALCTSAGAVPKHGEEASKNEDAGAVAVSAGGALLVIADAHFGSEAAEIAVDVVLDALGANVPPAVSDEELVALFFDVGVAVQRGTSASGSAYSQSRTTLALALVVEDGVRWAALGDSCVVLVTREGCERVDRPRGGYLGQQFDLTEIVATLATGRCDRSRARAVVLATDGLLALPEYRGDAAVAVRDEYQDERSAPELAERLVLRALEQKTSDAVTVAVGLVSRAPSDSS